MKTLLILSGLIIGIIVLLPGCYTQVGVSSENEHYPPSYGNENDTTYANGDYSAYENYHDNDDWDHAHVGFSYYYPSYWPSDYYAAAYASPWSFSFGFGYGYYGGYGGYYGGYYPYYPYYPYGPYYCGYYPYYYNQSIRTYGATRTGGPVRGSAYGGRSASTGTVSGTASDIFGRMPEGKALQGGSSGTVKRSGSTNVAPRTQGSTRVGRSAQSQNSSSAPQRYQDGRTGSRGSMGRITVPRSSQQANPTPNNPNPQTFTPPGRYSRGGQSRSAPAQPRKNDGASRYSAPPSSSGGYRGMSAPAPSMGGGRGAAAPSRGGGGGGRRP